MIKYKSFNPGLHNVIIDDKLIYKKGMYIYRENSLSFALFRIGTVLIQINYMSFIN